MKINWKVRFKNPAFIAGLVLAILTPILSYTGITLSDLTSWSVLGQVLLSAIANPYVLGMVVVSVYNLIIDPTTKGVSDSKLAMTYDEPKEDVK